MFSDYLITDLIADYNNERNARYENEDDYDYWHSSQTRPTSETISPSATQLFFPKCYGTRKFITVFIRALH
jgi:hypothetical protein